MDERADPRGGKQSGAISSRSPRSPPRAAGPAVLAPRDGIEPSSLVLIQSQAGPASRPTGEGPPSVVEPDCSSDPVELGQSLPDTHEVRDRGHPAGGRTTVS